MLCGYGGPGGERDSATWSLKADLPGGGGERAGGGSYTLFFRWREPVPRHGGGLQGRKESQRETGAGSDNAKNCIWP